MKIRILSLLLFLIPLPAVAQTYETIDACQALDREITAAQEEAAALSKLFDGTNDETAYLTDLYEGIKILTKTGEMFFKAADSHETACKDALKAAKNDDALLALYDRYLMPAQTAKAFFKKARSAAITLNRQGDVDTFNQTMVEFDTTVMQIVGVCETDLAAADKLPLCKAISAKFSDALQP